MKYSARLGAKYEALWDGMTVSAAKQAEARKYANLAAVRCTFSNASSNRVFVVGGFAAGSAVSVE